MPSEYKTKENLRKPGIPLYPIWLKISQTDHLLKKKKKKKKRERERERDPNGKKASAVAQKIKLYTPLYWESQMPKCHLVNQAHNSQTENQPNIFQGIFSVAPK